MDKRAENVVKHVTVRFAWHDNKWNGKICKNPEKNVYCIGNYSLLSPRIQRRIDPEIEDSYKDRAVSDTINEKSYLPPCYWSVNALGNKACSIEVEVPQAEPGGSLAR